MRFCTFGSDIVDSLCRILMIMFPPDCVLCKKHWSMLCHVLFVVDRITNSRVCIWKKRTAIFEYLQWKMQDRMKFGKHAVRCRYILEAVPHTMQNFHQCRCETLNNHVKQIIGFVQKLMMRSCILTNTKNQNKKSVLYKWQCCDHSFLKTSKTV